MTNMSMYCCVTMRASFWGIVLIKILNIANYAVVFIFVDGDLKLKKFRKINTWKIATRITIAAWMRLRLDIIPKIKSHKTLFTTR